MIATVGADLPFDLLIATGRYDGPLDWSIERETPRADAWLESKFAPWARSIVEDWASGAFDHLKSVVFSRSDDNSHRLYYYICELKSRGLVTGPEPIVFDVARLQRRSSQDHLIEQVRKLAKRLELTDDQLESGIKETNLLRIGQISPFHTTADRDICLIAGTPPPDHRLHRAVDAAGWAAQGQTMAELWRDLGAPVAEGSGDPAQAIANQLYADQKGPRGQYDPARRVVDLARLVGARAAILWYTEEEEALVWHLPAQRRALEAAGLRVLCLTRRDWSARDGVDRDIEQFLKGLTA